MYPDVGVNEVTVGGAIVKPLSLLIAKYWVPVVRLAAVKLNAVLFTTV